MKKYFLLSIIVLLCFSLMACGGQKAADEATPDLQVEETEVMDSTVVTDTVETETVLPEDVE